MNMMKELLMKKMIPSPCSVFFFRVPRMLRTPYLSESTPYRRTANISGRAFRGLFAGFSCLDDPPKSGTLFNVPLSMIFKIFYNHVTGVQREGEREKEREREREKGTRMRSLRPQSAGEGELITIILYFHFIRRKFSPI